MSDCPEPGCDWHNIYRTCQDGSRELERHYHRQEAHPYIETREDAPCSTCGTTIRLDEWPSICECGDVFCDAHYCESHGDDQ